MVTMLSSYTKQQINTIAQGNISQEDQQRKQQMSHAWRSYKGELQDPLKVAPNQPNDNVKSNRCEPIVNKGVSFLFGNVVKIEATDEAAIDPDASSPIQDFIDSLWGDDDDRMTKLSKMAVNGGCFGQCFLKLIPASGAMKYPRIVNLDPRLIRIVTDPEDVDLHLAYVIEYPGPADMQKRQIIARVDPNNTAMNAGNYDLDDTWTITDYLKMSLSGPWIQSKGPDEWLYPFPPIFTCQNLPNPNEAWGSPDLTHDLVRQNEVLNFILSNIARIIKFHGHPVTYATGLNASQISIAVDELICLPSPESKLEKLAAMDNFAGLLQVVANLMSNMDEQSRVPAVALGRLTELPKGNISGVALQLLFQPLIEKTTQKRRLYGQLIRDITRAALIINNYIAIDRYEDYKINLHWQPLIPIDDLAAAQTAMLYKQLGISTHTLLASLGFDAEDELEKSAQEATQQVTAFSQGKGLPPIPPNQQQPSVQPQTVPPGQNMEGQQ